MIKARQTDGTSESLKGTALGTNKTRNALRTRKNNKYYQI